MSSPSDILSDQIRHAIDSKQTLSIIGGDSKAFFGNKVEADAILSTQTLQGVVNYQPTELMISVAAGTPLDLLEQTLAEHGQMLPFEPLRFSGDSIGGCIACGLAGSRRPWGGGVRDAMLGLRLINGQAQTLRFGGEVMKNVAGFDVSRLMCGAQGTLGLITEVSLKVVPVPEQEQSYCFSADLPAARAIFQKIWQMPWPLSGMSWENNIARIRLSGTAAGVADAHQQIAKLVTLKPEDHCDAWSAMPCLTSLQSPQERLWRLSLPITATPLPSDCGDIAMADWGGSVLWLNSHAKPEHIRQQAIQRGGYAQHFGQAPSDLAQPPSPASHRSILQGLKQAFDPHHIFNPQRLDY